MTASAPEIQARPADAPAARPASGSRGCCWAVLRRLVGSSTPLWQRCIVVLVLYACTIFIFAAIFKELELPTERAAAEAYEGDLASLREAVLSLTNSTSKRAELLGFVRRIQDFAEKTAAAPSLDNPNWDFGGSVFFAMTLTSTIGYGTFAPQTPGGKAATVLLGTVGIVVTGLVLAVLGEAWSLCIGRAAKGCTRARKDESEQLRTRRDATAHCWAAALLGVAMLLIGAALLHATEGWDYGDALYATWVTASTVGFGDFAPSPRGAMAYIIIIASLALFAAIVDALATCVAAFSDSPEDQGDAPREHEEAAHAGMASTAGHRA